MIRHATGWAWGQVKQNLPMAIGGLAAMSAIGFLSSGLRPKGAFEGAVQGPLGASEGIFSGAVLGAAAGAGIVGLGIGVPTVRPAIGKFLTRVLASSPLQKLGGWAAGGLMERGLKAEATNPVLARQFLERSINLQRTINKFATPHQEAATFMIDMLSRKQASIMSGMAYGAIAGGAVGGAFGLGVGGARGAWQGGAKLRGPTGSTY